MPLAVSQDETPDPTYVRLLGALAVVLYAQAVAQLIEQPDRWTRCYAFFFIGIFHTPASLLDNATSIRIVAPAYYHAIP